MYVVSYQRDGSKVTHKMALLVGDQIFRLIKFLILLNGYNDIKNVIRLSVNKNVDANYGIFANIIGWPIELM